MELVYLWVEEYKNIHKQGFNFSPRLSCDYNDKTNELTINENDDYIENFFGENINVTAIVGKNGSGKSSVLKSLFQNDDNSSSKEKLWYILYREKLYFYNVDDMGIYEKEINLNKKYDIHELIQDSKRNKKNKKNLDFSMIYFSNIFQYLPVHNDKQNKSFYNISTSYLMNKYNKNNFINFKYQYNYYKSRVIMQTLSMLINADFKIDFDLPTELNIVTTTIYDSNNYENMKTLLTEEARSFYSRVKFNLIYNYLFNDLNAEQYNERPKDDKKTIQKFYEEIKEKNPLYNELDNLLDKFKDTDSIVLSIKIKDVDKELMNHFENFHKRQAISLGVLDVFHYNWKPELSSGQENLLFQFATFYNTIKNATNLKNEIIILIDEGETTMHPQWQKKYIQQYIKFLTLNFKDKQFHLILTTHSPFLLSDIPKQNIIFLDTDEEGKCKVVDGLKEKKQTFGANIHTLLSDSFFMEEGLMGEFAKGKINEIIDFHKEVEEANSEKEALKIKYLENQKKFWQTQSIVGEEYLKQVIKNHLVEIEKKLLGQDEAKKEEIKRVEAYLESLKK